MTTDSAKDAILSRVRSALADVPPGDSEPVPWDYGQPRAVGDVIEVFTERVLDYRAACERCSASELGNVVVAALQSYGVLTSVLPSGLDEGVVTAIGTAGIAMSRDDPPLTRTSLDGTDAVVTGCAVAAAETGTIMLDHGPDQGRRALTLVPDVHICIVRADQVVTDVPEAVAALSPAVLARRPITWISGGSATSDIELSRVEGVHGPRTLHVIIVDA